MRSGPALVALVLLALALVVAVILFLRSPIATPATPGPKTVLEIAYADDPSREALLWAIINGRISSDTVEVRVSLLPLGQIIPAANTKQYDAIEATPLAIPRTLGGEPGFLILSSGLVNKAGTVLFTGRDSAIQSPSDLRDKTVAVASLGGTFVLETRYVLQRKYGLNTSLTAGEVRFSETPQEAVPQLLIDGRLDAAVLTQLGTYRLTDSPDHRELINVTREFQELTGQSSANSVVVTYQSTAQEKGAALAELQRMLADSRAYLENNRSEVLSAVASSRGLEVAYMEWFFTAYDMAAGAPSAEERAQITASWEAAQALGDIPTVPDVEEVLFRAP